MSRKNRRRRVLSISQRRSLRFEPLEDRRLLATLTVNSALDNLVAGDGLVTLREAIVAANSDTATDLGHVGSGDDTIVFDPVVFATPRTISLALGEFQVTEALVIDGPGRDLLTINGQLQSRIFNITAATGNSAIGGMTLTGGKTAGDGGAIGDFSYGAQLMVNDCTIVGNSAAGNGGGIFAAGGLSSGALTVADSTISGNSVVLGKGAGIFGRYVTLTNSTVGGGISGGYNIDLADSTVTNGGIEALDNVHLNHSNVSGGIAGGQFGPYIVLIKSTITGGGLTGYGIDLSESFVAEAVSGSGDVRIAYSTVATGGVTGGDVEVINSTISGNIQADQGNVTLLSSTVSDGQISNSTDPFMGLGNVSLTNSALSGGGISASLSVGLTNSSVSGSSGAGIAVLSGDITLNNSTVSANGGDGVRVNRQGNVQVSNSNVTDNGRNGIGVYSGTVSLNSSTISGNSELGIQFGYYDFPAFLNVTKSSIIGNGKGGIRSLQGDSVILNSSIVSGNGHGSGTTFGGILAGSVTVSNSTVSGNWSGYQYGGGISAGFVSLTNSTVSGNTATGNGGGIRATGSTFEYSTVTNNHASAGGGVWIDNGPITIKGSLVAGNTSSAGNPDLRPGPGVLTVDNSLIGDNAGTTLPEAQSPDARGNLIGSSAGAGVIDPHLGPLVNNGGPTLTHALLSGSPAINAIPLVNIPDMLAHDYAIDGTLSDLLGGPALVANGGALTSSGYHFGPNQGLSLSSADIDPAEYSIEMVFSWDEVSDGWQKIIDFHGLALDVGLYALAGGLRFESQAYAADAFAAGELRHLVITRDGDSDVVRAYIDGSEVWSFDDAAGDAIFTGPNHVVEFFQDDHASGQAEAQSGFVDYIRLFSRVITDEEIESLANSVFTLDLPLYDQRGNPYERRSGGRVDMGAFELQPIPPAVAFGDFSLDGTVNAADYTVWRNTLGSSGLTPYSGADGSGNGSIGPEDYDVWKLHFGETVPTGGGGGAGGEVDKEMGRQGDKEIGSAQSVAAPRHDAAALVGANAVTSSGLAGASPSRWRAAPVVGDSQRGDALLAWLSTLGDAGRGRMGAEIGQIANYTGGASGTYEAAGGSESEGDFLACVDAVFQRVGFALNSSVSIGAT